MMKTLLIIFTGTPATGKTTHARKLCDYINKTLNKNCLYIGHNWLEEHYPELFVGYDSRRKAKIIDELKLDDIFREIKKKYPNKIIIFDSHVSHELSSDLVDLCFVMKCSLKSLKERLTKRNYDEEKIRENLEAEIFDVCRIDAIENSHKVVTINTDVNIDESFQQIIDHFLKCYH